MVSKPVICENDETGGDTDVDELPWNFHHP